MATLALTDGDLAATVETIETVVEGTLEVEVAD